MRLCGFVGLAILISATATVAQDASGLKQRLMREIPSKWDAYRDYARQLRGQVNVKRRVLAPVTQVIDRVDSIKQNGRSCLYVLGEGFGNEDQSDIKKGKIVCQNARYGFELTRASPNDAWTLAYLAPGDSVAMPAFAKSKAADKILGMVSQHFRLDYGTLLVDAIRDKGFSISNASNVAPDGKELVRIEFDYRRSISTRKVHEKGWVLVDPGRFWSVVEYQTSADDNGTKSMTRIAYDVLDDKNGMPIIKTLTGTVDLLGKDGRKGHEELTTKFDLVHSTDASDDEFKLTAFGLTEPAWLEQAQPRSRFWVWLLCAGVMCLAVGWWRRRASSERTGAT